MKDLKELLQKNYVFLNEDNRRFLCTPFGSKPKGFETVQEAQKSSTPQPNNNDDDKESRDNSLLNDNNIVKGQVIPFPEWNE